MSAFGWWIPSIVRSVVVVVVVVVVVILVSNEPIRQAKVIAVNQMLWLRKT